MAKIAIRFRNNARLLRVEKCMDENIEVVIFYVRVNKCEIYKKKCSLKITF